MFENGVCYQGNFVNNYLEGNGTESSPLFIFKASIITEQEFMENLRGIYRKISQLSMKVDSSMNNLTEKENYQIK